MRNLSCLLVGVWEILIVIWGFFFIASSRDAAPTMKGRNFAKSIQRGSSRVVRKRQNRSVQSSSSIPPESAEHQPAWDDVYISSGSETGGDKVRAVFFFDNQGALYPWLPRNTPSVHD